MDERNLRVMDEIGWKILETLQENARISFRDLGKIVNLSSTAVAERVRRMEELGIITSYRAVVDPRKVGYSCTAILSLATKYDNPDTVLTKTLAAFPEVVSCWSVTGNNDYFMEVLVPSLEFLEEMLIQITKHGRITTAIVLPSSIKKNRVEPPRSCEELIIIKNGEKL